MDDKKLSSKWHLIFGGITFIAALSAYPVWHVFINEQVIAQEEMKGRVAKVVVYYPPSSLRSYLGAYFPKIGRFSIRLKVTNRSGTVLKSRRLTETSFDPPAIVYAELTWSPDATMLGVAWHDPDWPGRSRMEFFYFPP